MRIEPLTGAHDRSAFTCGQAALDDWFRSRAGQDEKRNIARVFVAVDEARIIGFYSLSAFTLSLTDLPQDIAKKLPRYDLIPAALIGRLARHECARGQGMGALLLADALRRILSASEALGVFAIIVEAKDEQASTFYETFGFRAFPLQPRRLFMLSSHVAASLS